MNIRKNYKSDRMWNVLHDAKSKITLNKALLELIHRRTAEIHEAPSAVKRQIRENLASHRGANKRFATRTPTFNQKADMAVALTDAITVEGIEAVPELILQQGLQYFSKGELVRLVLAVLAANDWHYLQKGGQASLHPGIPLASVFIGKSSPHDGFPKKSEG